MKRIKREPIVELYRKIVRHQDILLIEELDWTIDEVLHKPIINFSAIPRRHGWMLLPGPLNDMNNG